MSFLSFLSNPVTLAFVTVAAINKVYNIINNQNEERAHSTRGSGSRKRRPDDSQGYRTSSSTHFKNSDSNIRQRQKKCDIKNETSNSEASEKSYKQMPTPQNVKKNPEFEVKNYERNVFDKIENDLNNELKNINQKNEAKKNFDKNIDVSTSEKRSSVDNFNDTKLVNVSDDIQNKTLLNISDSSGSNESQMELETKQGNCSSSVDATSINNQQEEIKSNKCKACTELKAKAVAKPCGHCYLCEECAIIIHRIYKKCMMCESVIDCFDYPASKKDKLMQMQF